MNNQFSWILLWIMNFRIRFNISKTATESLVKFMKLVLTEIGGNEFTNSQILFIWQKNRLVLMTDFIVSYLVQSVISFTIKMK